MSFGGPSGPAALIGIAAVVMATGTLAVHIILAYCVDQDARKLEENGKAPSLLKNWQWALVTLFTGVLWAAFYWVSNRSSLAQRD